MQYKDNPRIEIIFKLHQKTGIMHRNNVHTIHLGPSSPMYRQKFNWGRNIGYELPNPIKLGYSAVYLAS